MVRVWNLCNIIYYLTGFTSEDMDMAQGGHVHHIIFFFAKQEANFKNYSVSIILFSKGVKDSIFRFLERLKCKIFLQHKS